MTRRHLYLLSVGTLAVVSTLPANGRPAHPPRPPAAAAPALPTAEPDDAEKLFRRMEAKLVAATTLAVTVEGVFEGTFRGTLKGTLVCAGGNKSREELDGDLAFGPGDRKPVKMRMVSDGTKLATGTAVGADPQKQVLDAPTQLGAAQRLFLARAGVVAPPFLLAVSARPGEKPPDLKPDEHVKVGDFRLGGVEAVGGRDARVLHHSLTGQAFKESLAVTVWVDAKTDLPLKRVIAVKQGGLDLTLTETYSNLALVERIDAKQFEFPK